MTATGKGVRQDLSRSVRVGMGLDDLIEGPLHVEHHGVHAARRAVRVPLIVLTPVALLGGSDAGYRARGVIQ